MNSNSKYLIDSELADGSEESPDAKGSGDSPSIVQVGGSPFEHVEKPESQQYGLDDEHYMDEDMVKNGTMISNTKILPSMTEEENPFAKKQQKAGDPKEVSAMQQIDTGPPRKSKLSAVHQKSKSLMSQLNKFKEDALHGLNSHKDNASI